MVIERCHRCLGDQRCQNQLMENCLPVPFFGNIRNQRLKVVTVGLNPALNEFQIKGKAKERSQRLAILSDYNVDARMDLSDANVAEAKDRREGYFKNTSRDWHSYFERLESVLTRVTPAWTYVMGSAAHVDLVACATKDRWGEIGNGCQTSMIANCREYFLNTLSNLPNGTVILCDGARATREVQNLGLRVEDQHTPLISIRPGSGGDVGWRGDLFLEEKKFPVLGWPTPVGHLSALWRCNLASWIHGTFFPLTSWATLRASSLPLEPSPVDVRITK